MQSASVVSYFFYCQTNFLHKMRIELFSHFSLSTAPSSKIWEAKSTVKLMPIEEPAANANMGLRSLITCTFLIIAFSYIVYSTNLLITSRFIKQCPTDDVDHISLSFSNSTSIFSEQSESQETEFQTIDTQPQQKKVEPEPEPEPEPNRTNLSHVVFVIGASSKLWDNRKEYIKQWWRPNSMRGVVWMDKPVRIRDKSLPEVRVSGDTSRLPYTHLTGSRSALRISRAVSETLRLRKKDVRWFVMGDDDTIFLVDNVVSVLEKYNHEQYYYIGNPSESHIQNLIFSYGMAYGGGGFAISYGLAVELEKMQDQCIRRYAHLYGSDDRIHACMSELGVPLTRHPGFHQCDVYGDLLGLLAAHPVVPLVSLHHLDVVDPIIPGMTRSLALRRLFYSVNLDSASVMQQSICYDNERSWSILVSWGFVVQITRGTISPRELEIPARTFLNWFRNADYFSFPFNTRPVSRTKCQEPFTYYINSIHYDKSRNETVSTHSRRSSHVPPCNWKMPSPKTIDTIIVYKKPDPLRWRKAPRRDCCRVLPTEKGSTMHISVSNCEDDEFPTVLES